MPGAFCDDKSPFSDGEPLILTGGGVDHFELMRNPDGNQRLVLFIKLEAYPSAFDEWDLLFLGAAEYIQDYSSSVETSGDTITSVKFTVDLPSGAEVTQEGEFLSILIYSP